MTDAECVAFLQWALPQLHMRWAGFRKVRRTVCKRISRRLADLGVPDLLAYREYLANQPAEWSVLDGLCTITISRFYRDKTVFDFIGSDVLPQLVRAATAKGEHQVRVWSVGCACGEEPYTLALIWRFAMHAPPACALRVLGTDVGPTVLARAQRGCYASGSVRLLPSAWLARGFARLNNEWCLREDLRTDVTFLEQDVRRALPDGPFELILCRNLVFTYYDESQQRALLDRLLARLTVGGALVIGQRESLPVGVRRCTPWPGGERLGVFCRVMTS